LYKVTYEETFTEFSTAVEIDFKTFDTNPIEMSHSRLLQNPKGLPHTVILKYYSTSTGQLHSEKMVSKEA
jgi:hypothetical protein